MKWRRDGTSETPKPIDLVLDGVRLQVSSGVIHKSAYELRRNAVKEAWTLGGIWRDAILAMKAGRFGMAEFYEARSRGEAGVRDLMTRAGSEPLKDLIRDYLKQTKATDKPKMRQRLNRFHSHFGRKVPSVADVTTATVDHFLSLLTDLRTAKREEPVPAQGSTVNRYRAVIGGMCTWAVRVGRMTTHPIAGKKVEKREEPHHRLPELSANEYRDYMDCARAKRPDLAVVLLLLIHTAPDVGEVFAREARDADLETGRMRYERSKTRRYGSLPRFVPMPSVVLEEIRAHVAEHGVTGEQDLFGMSKRTDVEWLHKQCCAAISRPTLTLKDLRHVAAIAWVKAGVHIRLVSRWLGHRSLSQTMKYTDYEPDAAMAVEMAERAAQTLNQTVDVTPIRKALASGETS